MPILQAELRALAEWGVAGYDPVISSFLPAIEGSGDGQGVQAQPIPASVPHTSSTAASGAVARCADEAAHAQASAASTVGTGACVDRLLCCGAVADARLRRLALARSVGTAVRSVPKVGPELSSLGGAAA